MSGFFNWLSLLLKKYFICEPSILVNLRYLANISMSTMEKISYIRTGKKIKIQLWDLRYWLNLVLRNWIACGSLIKFLNGWTDCLWCLITICDWQPSFIPILKWLSNILNLTAAHDMVYWPQMDSGELNATAIESFGLFVFLDFWPNKMFFEKNELLRSINSLKIDLWSSFGETTRSYNRMVRPIIVLIHL